MYTDLELLRLNQDFFNQRILTKEDILEFFESCDAFWEHNGNLKRPHAELTSGLCSNGFFDCPRILKYPRVCQVMAFQIGKQIRILGIDHIDWVIGSAYSAITLSYEVAKLFGAKHGHVEKDPSDSKGKKMIWKKESIGDHEVVFRVEELITTSHTFYEVTRAVQEAHQYPIKFLPVVGTIVHRPPSLPVDYGEDRVSALIEKIIWAKKPDECHLCKAVSKRIRPRGTPTSWRELTGEL